MKKALFILSALALFTVTSCTRDWTCVCEFSDGTNPNQTAIGRSNRDAAEEMCNDFGAEAANLGAECALSE